MKALTVRQPHADRIASGRKTVELRTWPTRHRGPLIIHAGAAPSPGRPTGCTLCLVDLVTCRPATTADLVAACAEFTNPAGLYAWQLANPRPLPHLPCRGQLSLWRPPPDLLTRLAL